MSRKKKGQPATSALIAPASPDLAGSAGTADVALRAARYKEAIERFKDLLKRERRPAWLTGLAAAYSGRAEQLAGKGMLKEALALWRTRSEACGVPLLDGPYLGWLMKTGKIELALGLIHSVDDLPPEARERARAQLALAVLVAPDELLANLPEESVAQRAAARSAITAALHDDASNLEQALRTISFHSPYRDLRGLLKALALQASNPRAAAATLERVSEKGPFQALAQALRVCLMPGTAWVAGMRALDEAGRTLVLDLKGCPQPQRAAVLELATRASEIAPTPLELLDLLLRHRRVLPDGMARRLGLRLLPHAPQRLDSFRAGFAPPSAAEQEHVLALAAELKQKHEQAEPHWLRLVKLLGSQPSGQRRAALVLRRLAGQHSGHSPDGSLCVHAEEWLAQSLHLDPSDRDSYLRLLRDARLHGELKHARAWLDKARLQFPDDALVLREAVEIALASGAFKKAAGLAKQALRIDPINTGVRALIGQAHLAHVRKLLRAQNLPAARRELDEAAEWLRGADQRGLLELLRGFAAESAAAGDTALRQAVADLGGPLVGAFHLLLEGKRIKGHSAFAPQDLVRRAGVDLTSTPAAAEVVALAQALHANAERDPALPAVLGVLSGMLTRAVAALRMSEREHLLVCEALHRHGQPDLTGRFAAAALKHWPGRPVFVYLEAAARFHSAPWNMSEVEWKRLDRVFEEARRQGDERTAARLSRLLGDARDPGDSDFPQDLDDFDEDGDADFEADDLDAMANTLEVMLKRGGVGRFLDFARQQLGATVFDQLRREIKGSERQFARTLLDTLMAAAEAEAGAPARGAAPAPARRAGANAPPANKNQAKLFDE